MHSQLQLNQNGQNVQKVRSAFEPVYEQVVQHDDDNNLDQDQDDCCILVRDLDSGIRSLVDPKTIQYAEIVPLDRKKSAWEDYWAQREVNKHELIKIVNSHDEQQLISLLKLRGKQIDLNQYVYMDGWTLLHHSVHKNSVQITLTLLLHNININTGTKSMHRTALHLSVLNNNQAMIHLLLSFGANPNLTDIDFCSPLHYAAEYGYFRIMRLFLWDCQNLQLYCTNCRKLNVKECCRDVRIRDLITVYQNVHMLGNEQVNGGSDSVSSGSMNSISSRDQILKRDAYNGVWTNKQGKQCLVRARSDFIQRILNQSNKSHDFSKQSQVQNPQPSDIISLVPKQSDSTTSTPGTTKVKLLPSLGSKISKQKYSKFTELASRSLLNYKESITQSQVPNVETIDNYELIKQLGSGTFGTVFLIRKKKSSKLMAVKRLSKRLILQNKLKKYAYAQREILKQIKHPFILHGYSFFQDPVYLYMVMDFCAGGDLQKMIRKGKFDQHLAKKYCCQVVSAIQELHKRNYLFRDLKPSNVLLDQSGHIKLSDFGLAKQSQMSHSFLGSVSYLAPEMLVQTDNKPHTAAIDWYLLGVFVFQMLVGIPPFFNENRIVMFQQIKRQKPRIPTHLSPECKDFLIKTLAKKPNQRLGNKGAFEIKNHKWLKDVDWSAVLEKKLNMQPPQINQKQLRSRQYIQEEDLMQQGGEPNTFKGWDFCEGERN